MYKINFSPIDPGLYAEDPELLQMYEMANGREGFINPTRREYLLGKLATLETHAAYTSDIHEAAGIIVSEKRPAEDKLWVDCLAVQPHHRNQRLGSQLLQFAGHYALSNNLSHIELCVVNNTNEFYLKNGFKEANDVRWSGLSKIYRKKVI